jgi:hypothetical protein
MGRAETGSWLFRGSKVVAPLMSIKDHAVLTTMSKFRIILTAYRTFMESDKSSSLVTTLLNCISLLQGDFMEGE